METRGFIAAMPSLTVRALTDHSKVYSVELVGKLATVVFHCVDRDAAKTVRAVLSNDVIEVEIR